MKNYGIIAKLLIEMTKKGNFQWTAEREATFIKLKEAMASTPVLAMPDFKKPFEVHTDACDLGIGVVLLQDGHPIAYLSKALGIKIVGWSIYVKEMLAIVEAVRVWWPYLLGRKFQIVT